jgi:hypothetical protein
MRLLHPPGTSAPRTTKHRGAFPSDEALIKLLYLALRNISKRWTLPIRDWKVALNRFIIQFEDRMPQLQTNPVYTKFCTRSTINPCPPSLLNTLVKLHLS